jgi:hypothetical protein
MFGNGRRRSQGFKWIKNRQVLKWKNTAFG